MKDDIVSLLVSDLLSIFIANDNYPKGITPSKNFYNLINGWLTKNKNAEDISAAEYIIFKKDLQNLLQAEIELGQEAGKAGIWLIDG